MEKISPIKIKRRDFTVLSALAAASFSIGGIHGCAGRGPEAGIVARPDDDGKILPIFEEYPGLKGKIPYVSLGRFPTPVENLECIGEEIGHPGLYIKRDDISGEVYGGNKVRKLEFLLGKALSENAKEVLTFGGAGSNHALATAIYAKQLGMRSISMLVSQPNARYVRDNLLAGYSYNAELHHHRGVPSTVAATSYQFVSHKLKHGSIPEMIMFGGSSPLGTVGYVNAALELKRQITQGLLPEPDLVYVALGSCGTAAGLALGLKAAGLKTKIMAVRIVEEMFANEKRFKGLFDKTRDLLKSVDPLFSVPELKAEDVEVVHDFYGEGYAIFTVEGMEAVRRMREVEGIKLDGTYTGKTFAALMADAQNGKLEGKTALFWDTYNSRDLSGAVSGVDYHLLPERFHRYFEEDLQLLDE